MGDLADHLPLVQIKTQFDTRVLQVIVPAAGKGLVGAGPRRDRRRQNEQEK